MHLIIHAFYRQTDLYWMNSRKGGAKKLVTFAMYCTDSWETCDMENQKSIGDFCGELQRVFLKDPKMEFFTSMPI